MFGPDMDMAMEEGEEDLSDGEDDNEAENAIEALKKRALEKKGVVGFNKGGDVDKSLKAAKKNARANTAQEEEEDDDSDEDEDEEEPEAKAESDEDSDDFDLDDEEDEEDEVAAKITAKAKETQKKLGDKVKPNTAKPVKKEESSEDDISSLEDDDDDDEDEEEEVSLQAMLAKK
jgi:hypothetical protein